MTVIRHNSISGIVSITAAAGSNLSFYDSAGATLSLDTGNINAGVITATTANFTNATVTGDLTVQGTTTTLDTTVTEVDKLEVGANNTTVGVAITQSGTGDILRLYDSASQVVTVKDGGSVGIGTDDPTAGTDGESDDLVIHRASGAAGMTIKTAANATGAIRFADPDGASQGRIEYNHPSDYLRWNTGGSEKLRLDSSGNLSFAADTDTYISHPASDTLALTTGGTERLRITSGGKLGVNTNAISAQFEVRSAASTINAVTIKTSAGAGGYAGLAFMAGQTSAGREKAAIYFQETNNGAHYTGDIVFALNNDSGSAVQVGTSDEKVRITSSGNVGIGTAVPQAKFAISGAENTVVEIQPNISSGISRILSFNRVSNAYRGLRLDGSELRLETSSLPKLRIAANGNVGIGDDFDANNWARLTVYEDNYTYGRSLAPTSTGQYNAGYVFPRGTLHYRNNTDSGTIGVKQYVQAEAGYPNAQGYLDVLIKNSGFYTIRIKASDGSSSAAVATMLVYGLANSTNSNHPVVSITGASGGGNANPPTFASGHGKGSANAVATFWWEVLNYNVNTYDCTMRIHTTHSNNQGLRAIIEECVG